MLQRPIPTGVPENVVRALRVCSRYRPPKPKRDPKDKRRRRRGSAHEALGLVIMDPWITKILAGQKTWELRTRSTNVRGRVALIRSGSGKIYGTAELVDCIQLDAKKIRGNVGKHRVRPEDALRYANGGALYAWVFKDARAWRSPRPYKHPSGAVIWVGLKKEQLRAA